jgi:hypothetical protein
MLPTGRIRTDWAHRLRRLSLVSSFDRVRGRTVQRDRPIRQSLKTNHRKIRQRELFAWSRRRPK